MNVFIASSGLAKSEAKQFIQDCNMPGITYFPWWEHFRPGDTLLEGLDDIANQVQGAVVLLTPDIKVKTLTGIDKVYPNQNVLFEFGYFCGKLGRNNVAVLKFGKMELPSDLGGHVYIFGSKNFHPQSRPPISKRTKKEYQLWCDSFINSHTVR